MVEYSLRRELECETDRISIRRIHRRLASSESSLGDRRADRERIVVNVLVRLRAALRTRARDTAAIGEQRRLAATGANAVTTTADAAISMRPWMVDRRFRDVVGLQQKIVVGCLDRHQITFE